MSLLLNDMNLWFKFTRFKRSHPKPLLKERWYASFFSIRNRILILYVLLMACSTQVSIAAIRHVLYSRFQDRVQKNLVQEVEEFRLVLHQHNPQTVSSLAAVFHQFFSIDIPDEGEFMLAALEGKFYQSSPTALHPYLQKNSALVKAWAQQQQPVQGEEITPTDKLLYAIEPIAIAGETRGAFIIVQSTAVYLQDIEEVVTLVTQVTMGVLLVACILAWIASGQGLAPLRLLTETTRSISTSDLTQRISVRGSDEIAVLTIAFNQMLDRLHNAFAIQRNFINDASHELRTPITIIRGHLELMGDDPSDRRETLALVNDELDLMSRIVHDLLLLAKAEQPNFLHLEPLEVGEFTEELFAKIAALGDRAWTLDGKASGAIVADRQRLTQAIVNLAQNATQHTQSGDLIALGSSLNDTEVRFWVRDTGTGIPPEQQQRIFQRFARGGRRRSEGAGLGLAIVEAIAEAHHGRVELQSTVDRGSIFTLALPVNYV